MKDITDFVSFQQAFQYGMSMKELTATVSVEMRDPLQSIIQHTGVLDKFVEDK